MIILTFVLHTFYIMDLYRVGEKIEKEDFQLNAFLTGEYENCIFSQCNFSSVNLSLSVFIDCEFINCNLSLMKLQDTAFRNVKFVDCKMLGLRFDITNDFGFEVSFSNCNLANSIFWKKRLKDTLFKDCNLSEVDFNDCDLTKAKFVNSDLSGAAFERTKLVGCDFRSAYSYRIDPEKNDVKKAVFSLQGVRGLLSKYDIKIE